MRIPYRRLPGDNIARPYLIVEVPIGGDWVRRLAIVDSGADHSLLPLALAINVGVRFDPEERLYARGAGGAFGHYRAEEDVQIRTEVGPLTLMRPALAAQLPIIALGRADFFATYRVDFGRTEMTIEPHG